MTRPAIRIIDLTTRLGEQALSQCRTTRADTDPDRSLCVSFAPGLPAIDWVRPPRHADDLSPGAGPAVLFLLVGPGSVRTAQAVLLRAIAAQVPRVRVLLMPNALVEESALQLMLRPDDEARRLYRLPDSSPETLWFVLGEEFNKLSGQVGPAFSTTAQSQKVPMSNNLQQSMTSAMTIDGAVTAALVDYRSGMCLAQAGTGINLDLAAAGNTQVVRAKLQTMETLGLRKGIEDILITLTDQYHLIRLVPNNVGLFLYLVLDRAKGNLALARYKLTEIERALKV